MFRRSTTFRFAALVFLLQVAAAGALLFGVRLIVREQVHADAAATARVLQRDLLAVRAGEGAAALARAVALRAGDRATPGTVLLLADAAGRRVAGNLADWPPNVRPGRQPAEVELYRIGHAEPEAMLVGAVRLPDGARLLTGSVVEGERRALRLLEAAMLAALSVAIAFAALAAWLAARMIVRRLDGTIATLDAVRGGALAARVPEEPGDDAFAALGEAINAALARTEALVDELRVATDMLAHDLKSPITRLRSALERAAAAADTPAAQDAIDRAAEEGARLLALVETALRITRAEAGIGRESFVPVDVGPELAGIGELYAPLAEDAGRTIMVAASSGHVLSLHRELIAQAIGNLFDNALKYGEGAIRAALSVTADGAAEIAVEDRGPGIAAADRQAALRRFGRLDSARGGSGAGLGLSLVAAVARLHGGTVRLEDAGPGLRVVVALPPEVRTDRAPA